MKIAILQFSPAFCNPEKTIISLKPLLEKADEADLIVLPELANSGYNFRTTDEAFQNSENPETSPFTAMIHAFCKAKKCAVVTGFNEKSGDKIFNSSFLVDETGIKGKYRKIHLFWNEKDFFHPGDGKPEVYDVKGAKVGMLICFDWMFPEIWRFLALKGAEIICDPSNLVLPGKAQKAIPVHAMINRIYVALANRVGAEGGLAFTGNSLIAGPEGEVLVSASANKNEVIMAEINPEKARDKMITPRNHAFDDRRPEFYF
jgi:predicted amidohydrolase